MISGVFFNLDLNEKKNLHKEIGYKKNNIIFLYAIKNQN
jgi:hypothetical protein